MTSALPEIGWRGKPREKPLLTWSLVDPTVACRKSRSKIVAAPPVATFLLVEISRYLEGMFGGRGGGDSNTKKLALISPP
jgi:hypothetical protein